jgi:hypothetical protein
LTENTTEDNRLKIKMRSEKSIEMRGKIRDEGRKGRCVAGGQEARRATHDEEEGGGRETRVVVT